MVPAHRLGHRSGLVGDAHELPSRQILPCLELKDSHDLPLGRLMQCRLFQLAQQRQCQGRQHGESLATELRSPVLVGVLTREGALRLASAQQKLRSTTRRFITEFEAVGTCQAV